MAIKFNYDKEEKIIFTQGYDIVTLQDLMDYGEEIATMDSNLEGAVEYIDFSEIKDISVTYQTAKRMLSVYSKWIKRGVRGSIIYAPTDISFGMARMIGAVLASVMNVAAGGPEIVREPLKSDEIRQYFK